MSPQSCPTGPMGSFTKPKPSCPWLPSAAKSTPRSKQRARSAPASFSTALESKNWRETMGALPAITMPSFDNLKLGMVFLLPGDQDVKDALDRLGLEDTNRPWDHPAVVIGKYEQDGEEWVKIRTCTTFDRQHVAVAKPDKQQKLFLLAENIEDVIPHWSTSLGKMVPGTGKFAKRTYVNLSRNSVYDVKYTMLKLYRGQLPMQFDAEALNMILRERPY